jgi:hypothetical protein
LDCTNPPYSPFAGVSIYKYQKWKDETRAAEEKFAADQRRDALEQEIRERPSREAQRAAQIESGFLCKCSKCSYWGSVDAVAVHELHCPGTSDEVAEEEEEEEEEEVIDEREEWRKRMQEAGLMNEEVANDEDSAFIDNPAGINPNDYEALGLRPWDYTISNSGQRWIVGPNTYFNLMEAELARVLPLKGVWGDTGDGYQERFPGTDEFGVPCWHWELYKNLRDSSTSKKVLCSWEMQLHQIKVGNEFYAGTEREGTWSIFHDALSYGIRSFSERSVLNTGSLSRIRQTLVLGML